ncbi:putative protein kinase RLK-Pelle-WAK family [Rosa chinensis]|uniref:Protein kinase domain-containing protein n=1 Tax=Rosa chinensis TaxID=74649 RepID=A0A2P6PE90_ROSCH|nr:putative protein kinase RLK-Pelle-WAK family [Rosa chinensis]
MRSNNQTVGGCMSTCGDNTVGNGCIGTNCCQTILPQYLSEISTKLQSESAEADSGKQPDAILSAHSYAFMVDQEWFQNNISYFGDIKDMDNVPVVLEWRLSLDKNSSSFTSYEKFIAKTYLGFTLSSIPYMGNSLFDSLQYFRNITLRQDDDPTPYCNLFNATSPTNNLPMLQCFCPAGYDGNPFLVQPCQDIDECQEDIPCMGYDTAAQKWNFSGGSCQNTDGGHICYSSIDSVACEFHGGWSGQECGIYLGFALLLLFIAARYVYTAINKKKHIIRKKMFFKRNGGLLLEQQLRFAKINGEKIKLFKSKELEKSTDNFSINRILGHGGHGTVYKGMLKDGRIVAVKKSKLVDESKLAEFINEVVILSEIKHRNVVKLLGCCLETEIPIVVYEFIPNGTLFQYIHDEKNEEFPLTWKMRLRIATEIAGALSYLHATASCPIYHRDIKSTNILLDEKYRAKIADFGTSRSVAIDQTHLTTLVHGTFGYLDPEYFRSSKFTEKSDVYSFGVVLVELLTGKKPVSAIKVLKQEEEYQSLVACFIILMQENRLFDIVDEQVSKEGSKKDIRIVANLAEKCLDLNGRKRPTMREVTTELEVIQMSKTTSIIEQIYEDVELPCQG